MNWTKLIPRDFLQADTKTLRRFGLVMAVPLLIIAAILYWKGYASTPWWAGVAGLFGLLGLALPIVLKPVYIVWMTFAYYLSFVMTFVILTLFFFLVMTPAGLIMRLFGKDPMDRRFPGVRDSYWVSSQTYENTIERYSKPY
ncbi:MAG: SxtJ family membrane protein [Candidatus Zixiibacteriota bacterium]